MSHIEKQKTMNEITLTTKQVEKVTVLRDLMNTNPICKFLLSHGKIADKERIRSTFAATILIASGQKTATQEDGKKATGEVADMMNKVRQSGLLDSRYLKSAFAHFSGSTQASYTSNPLGILMRDAMKDTVARALPAIRAGKKPESLYFPKMEKDGAKWILSYKLGRETLKQLGWAIPVGVTAEALSSMMDEAVKQKGELGKTEAPKKAPKAKAPKKGGTHKPAKKAPKVDAKKASIEIAAALSGVTEQAA